MAKSNLLLWRILLIADNRARVGKKQHNTMDHSRIKDTSAAGGEYLLLIEFVHRHLGFHDAELESVLEMSGIKLGVDCQLRPLPNNGTDSKTSTNYTRPFKILSFPWSSIGSKFSITSEGDNEEKETKSRIKTNNL